MGCGICKYSYTDCECTTEMHNAYDAGYDTGLAIGKETVTVKSLEWEVTDWSSGDGVYGENDCGWSAKTGFNSYGYTIDWMGDHFLLCMDDETRTQYQSRSEAMAAAQANYDALVRALLK